MKTFLNYLGQLRIYSLVDIVLLLVATHANVQLFAGSLLLWISFLCYLETSHKHSYRKTISPWLWIVLGLIGAALYRKPEVILFVVASYIYTQKTRKNVGLFSSLFRAMQNFFLVIGIVGFGNPLTGLSLVLVFIRNALGDLRDLEKDKKEGMTTLPMLLGFKKSVTYVHLVAVMLTSLVWWHFADISGWWLLPIFALQIFTYNLTPR